MPESTSDTERIEEGRRKMTPLIFLDVDGVLNTHDFSQLAASNTIHREKVGTLNRILAATGASIVLSSAWRYLIYRGDMDQRGMDWLFRSHGIMASRVRGITRKDTMISTPMGPLPLEDERGEQIREWLAINVADVPPYVVIDDGGIRRSDGQWTDLGIVAAGHPFVRTMADVGLTEADADRAISILVEKE